MKFNSINIVVCSLIVLCVSVMTSSNIVSSKALDCIDFSFQSFISGQLTQDINNSIDKHIFEREKIIHFSDMLKNLKGVNLSEDIAIIDSDGINVNTALNNTQPMDTDWGKIILHDGKALEVCTFNEAASQKYAAAINQLASHSDLNVNLMLIPTQIEFIEAADVQSLTYSQKASIDFIYHQLDNHINAVNVYDVLKAHSDEYIYFRSDHHWTSLGAYYAYCELMTSLGKQPLSRDDFEAKTSVPFIGSLYTLTNSDTLLENPDLVTAYKPKLNYTYEVLEEGKWVNKQLISEYYLDKEKFAYEVFLDGDYMLSRIITDADCDERILIVKDSYANALIPFLVPHYEQIYIIDPRSYEDDFYGLIKENGLNDILIVNYALVNRFSGYADFYTTLFE